MTDNTENYNLDRLLLIDKPLEWTSFDVVNCLRCHICRTAGIKKLKVGHAGTLDPLATGLLLICTGKKTKEIDLLQGMNKEYSGVLKLGATTPSFDKETAEEQHFDISNISPEMIYQTALQLTGSIEQIPPIFSAIKVNGKNAYLHARKGHDITLKARNVTIYRFTITDIQLPFVSFVIQCSKGTYIRSLANDFGKILNNGAYLTELRRIGIGDFSIEQARSVEEAKKDIESWMAVAK
jgi:tRNA pseudouridine55 synthase